MMAALESINGIANTRLYFSQMVAELSVADLNFIPAGFKNNIAWHLGNIVSVQQSLCYGLSHLSFKISKEVVSGYAGNTKLVRFIEFDEMEILEYNLSFTMEALKKDLVQDIFKMYQPYTTLIGVILKSIEDAIAFNSFHEQLHLRKASGIKSVIK